jgi:hypothetical protein
MLDFGNFPTANGIADVQLFVGTTQATNTAWQTWVKPRGKSFMDLLLIGKGGNGGTGVIGAAGGGGGGGGSGSQCRVTMPLHLVPDILYLQLIGQGASSATPSVVTVQPVATAASTIAYAGGGTVGSNAATTTGGAGGTAGSAAGATNMPLGWAYASSIGGQAGTAGGVGTTVGAVGVALTLPVTGLLVTGGTGGGGCPTTAALAGLAGGLFTNLGFVPQHLGGTGGTGTTPPSNGTGGYRAAPGVGFWLGGTGGGSSGTNATGAGLVQGTGGNGAWGCGGGGMGAGFTGSSAGQVGQGGSSFCIITCW